MVSLLQDKHQKRLEETPRKSLEPLLEGAATGKLSLVGVDQPTAEAAMRHFALRRLDKPKGDESDDE